jgi:hypothetical protein
MFWNIDELLYKEYQNFEHLKSLIPIIKTSALTFIQQIHKNICVSETVLRVLAFARLGYRLGPQTLLSLAKVPFLA